MKKISIFLMVLGLFSALLGCTKRTTGPWVSLTYHVTSSVRTEGCHFVITREADGGMKLSGYCFDGETEYRVEEAKLLSQETVNAIEAMELDKAATSKQNPSGMADGTQVAVTLGYPDGSEQKISPSAEQRVQLKQLLQKELVGT